MTNRVSWLWNPSRVVKLLERVLHDLLGCSSLQCDTTGSYELSRTAGGGMGKPTPEEIPSIKYADDARRPSKMPFEIVVEGRSVPDDEARAREIVRPWATAGATWYIATKWAAIDMPKTLG